MSVQRPSIEQPLTGRCACGTVHFAVSAPFEAARYCHCHNCQRRTGTSSSPNARVAAAAFTIEQGEEALRARCGRGRAGEVVLRRVWWSSVQPPGWRRLRLRTDGRAQRRSRDPPRIPPVGQLSGSLGADPERRPAALRRRCALARRSAHGRSALPRVGATTSTRCSTERDEFGGLSAAFVGEHLALAGGTRGADSLEAMSGSSATATAHREHRRGQAYALGAALAWSTSSPSGRSRPRSRPDRRARDLCVRRRARVVRIGERVTLRAALRSVANGPGLIITTSIAIASASFIVALNHTSVAHVLVMQAVAPILAALFAFVALREPLCAWTSMATAPVRRTRHRRDGRRAQRRQRAGREHGVPPFRRSRLPS